MKIITISREFGSGGRELGKRLADTLDIAYYDREILSAIAEKSQLDERYVANLLEKGIGHSYPITYRHTFSLAPCGQDHTTRLLVAQQQVLKALAQRGEDCVIVGRCADVILRAYNPLNLFVYADLAAKMQCCRERAAEDEHLSDRDLERKIRQIDAERARHRALLANGTWGKKEYYHLCLNTTGLEIKGLTAVVADYSSFWFKEDHV